MSQEDVRIRADKLIKDIKKLTRQMKKMNKQIKEMIYEDTIDDL
jgi:hypothetical protein